MKNIESLTQQENQVLDIMDKWVKGEVSSADADQALKKAGVILPKQSR